MDHRRSTPDRQRRRNRRRGPVRAVAILATVAAALSLAIAPASAQATPAIALAPLVADPPAEPPAAAPDSNAIDGAGVPAPASPDSLAARASAPATDTRITGPIPATATSYPFGAADHTRIPENLADIGYVEEEYFVSGLANIYTWPAPGPAVVRTPNAPYTTRILVRRPAKASSFSGNVVVEPLNPSNLFDLNLGWGLMHDQLIRNGDVWVGVTVKPVSMQTLKTFDPARYAPLAMDNPLPLTDPGNCATVPSDSSRSTENGLAWDIYSQVGQLLRGQSCEEPGVLRGPEASARAQALRVRLFADRRLHVRLHQCRCAAGQPAGRSVDL